MILNFKRWKQLFEQETGSTAQQQTTAPAAHPTAQQQTATPAKATPIPPKPDPKYFTRADLKNQGGGPWQYSIDRTDRKLKLRIVLVQDKYLTITFEKDGRAIVEYSGVDINQKPVTYNTPIEGVRAFLSNANLSDDAQVGSSYARMIADIASVKEHEVINDNLWKILKNTIIYPDQMLAQYNKPKLLQGVKGNTQAQQYLKSIV